MTGIWAEYRDDDGPMTERVFLPIEVEVDDKAETYRIAEYTPTKILRQGFTTGVAYYAKELDFDPVYVLEAEKELYSDFGEFSGVIIYKPHVRHIEELIEAIEELIEAMVSNP
jgi:hypothetical protein